MKAAVIYWSGTGNTEQMANAIAEGAGAELFSVSDFTGILPIMTELHLAVLQWEMKFWKNPNSNRSSLQLKVH